MAAQRLRTALDLWRGPTLVDVRLGPVLEIEAMRLEESRLVTVERRIDADLRLGRHAGLIAELMDLTARHPQHEGLHCQVMVALYRSGRQEFGALASTGGCAGELIERTRRRTLTGRLRGCITRCSRSIRCWRCRRGRGALLRSISSRRDAADRARPAPAAAPAGAAGPPPVGHGRGLSAGVRGQRPYRVEAVRPLPARSCARWGHSWVRAYPNTAPRRANSPRTRCHA